jgi:hypothetical protein
MRKKSLLETNPFLKDPAMRMRIIETVTVSSSSIEGVHVAAEQAIKNVAKIETLFSAARASRPGKNRSENPLHRRIVTIQA